VSSRAIHRMHGHQFNRSEKNRETRISKEESGTISKKREEKREVGSQNTGKLRNAIESTYTGKVTRSCGREGGTERNGVGQVRGSGIQIEVRLVTLIGTRGDGDGPTTETH